MLLYYCLSINYVSYRFINDIPQIKYTSYKCDISIFHLCALILYILMVYQKKY